LVKDGNIFHFEPLLRPKLDDLGRCVYGRSGRRLPLVHNQVRALKKSAAFRLFAVKIDYIAFLAVLDKSFTLLSHSFDNPSATIKAPGTSPVAIAWIEF
jgi:hypothetical protein